SAPVASQGLHGGVVHDLYGTTKSPGEIKSNPTASQIVGFRSRAVSQHWAGIADRHHVIRPIRGKPFNPCHHLSGTKPRAGAKRSGFRFPGRENLHLMAADVDDEDTLDCAARSGPLGDLRLRCPRRLILAYRAGAFGVRLERCSRHYAVPGSVPSRAGVRSPGTSSRSPMCSIVTSAGGNAPSTLGS